MKRLMLGLLLVVGCQSPNASAYHWFDGETATELAARINAAGPGARLEVRVDARKSMTLRVVHADTIARVVADHDLNKSNICPPVCP